MTMEDFNIQSFVKSLKHNCHWNEKLVCERQLMCEGCEYQPKDDEKVNGKKEPIQIGWEKDPYNCGVFPYCPACGEMAYSVERCVFCGQRFVQDQRTDEWNKPPETVKRNCPKCGGIKSLVGTRSKVNGHFHGKCEKCGCILME